MHLALATSVGTKAVAILLFTGVIAPVVGIALKRVAGTWGSYGGGPFSIQMEPRDRGGGATPVDPTIQAAEVRQMLAAKAERQKVRGEEVLDVEAESARLLAVASEHAPTGDDEELRTEVRQLVVARNERRLRAGLEALDVETETERQLADLA